MRSFGVIPVKSESTRFPEKNFSEFNEKTLIVNTLEKMLKHIDTIFISTDDPDRVRAMLELHGHKPKTASDLTDNLESGTYVLYRSKDLCKPDTPADDVIFNITEYLNFFFEDYVIVLCQVTSPNWKSHMLKYALYKHEQFKYKKTIVSVSPDYKPNGCFYIFTKSKFLEYQRIYTPDLYLVVLDWKQSTDINYIHQLFIAEALSKGDYDE